MRPPTPFPAGGISPIPSMEFNTDSIPGTDRFGAWHDFCAPFCTVLPSTADARNDFHLHTRSWHLGGSIVLQTASSCWQQLRTAARNRSDGIDHYWMILQEAGESSLDADGRRFVLHPGQLLMTDMSRPMRHDVGAGRHIILIVPREELDEALPRPLDLHGLQLLGMAATLLASHLQTLARGASSLQCCEAPGVAHSTVQMITAALAPAATSPSAPRPLIEATLLRQMCRYIEMHLTDEALSPEAMWSNFRISRATLYRLFEPLGGVSAFIRERRLLKIHAQLLDEQARKPLARLAEDYGFKSAGHFSHAFRSKFGYPPSEARTRACTLDVDLPGAAQRDAPFAMWLKSLRT